MLQFNHATPAFRTYCGPAALSSLPSELERAGVSRAVIVCGGSVSRTPGLLDRIESVVGHRFAGRFEGVQAHSPVPAVIEATDALRRFAADGVIAVGGGSAVVTARAATILLAEEQSVRSLCTHRGPDGRLVSPKLLAPKLPQWVVATSPTTACSKAGSALQDPGTGDRLALFDPKTRVQGLFLDPLFASTAPDSLVESAGLNALAMAVAGLESRVEDPLAEALLRQAFLLLAELLPAIRQHPDPVDLRLRLMAAALLCGQGTDYTGGGACGAISHVVGPFTHVANGYIDAIVLPHVVRFNASCTAARQRWMSNALGAGREDPLADAIDAWLARMPIARRLRDVGLARDALPGLARKASDDWSLQRNPRPVALSDIEGILEAAW